MQIVSPFVLNRGPARRRQQKRGLFIFHGPAKKKASQERKKDILKPTPREIKKKSDSPARASTRPARVTGNVVDHDGL